MVDETSGHFPARSYAEIAIELRKDGTGYRKIAERLNALGYSTLRERAWTTQSVYVLLRDCEEVRRAKIDSRARREAEHPALTEALRGVLQDARRVAVFRRRREFGAK